MPNREYDLIWEAYTQKKVIEEKNLKYKVPSEPSELLNDFYILTLLDDLLQAPSYQHKVRDESVKDSAEAAVEKLLPPLKKELLSAVFFAVASEFMYIYSQQSATQIYDFFEDAAGQEGADFFKAYHELQTRRSQPSAQGKPNHPLNKDLFDGDSERYAGSAKSRRNKYNTLLKSLEKSGMGREKFMRLAEMAFEGGTDDKRIRWAASYGGKPWASIARGWTKLNNAEKLEDQKVWIDHVYDLQHNTDTVFNKIQEYTKDGSHSWIGKALDFKRELKTPWQLFDEVSPSVKPFISFVSPMLGFGTKEEYEKALKNREKSDSRAKRKAAHGSGPAVPDFVKAYYDNQDDDDGWLDVSGQDYNAPNIDYDVLPNSSQKTQKKVTKSGEVVYKSNFTDSDGVKYIAWSTKDGKYHNEGAPALSSRFKIVFYHFGKKHRMDGPAVEIYDTNYNEVRDEYWQFGELHNEHGPAVENYETGEKQWWYKGKQYETEDDWELVKNSDKSSSSDDKLPDLTKIDLGLDPNNPPTQQESYTAKYMQ